MTLDVSFCTGLMVNEENSPVRTLTLFPKYVTFIPRYGQLVLGNSLKSLKGFCINENFRQTETASLNDIFGLFKRFMFHVPMPLFRINLLVSRQLSYHLQ